MIVVANVNDICVYVCMLAKVIAMKKPIELISKMAIDGTAVHMSYSDLDDI